MTRPYPHVLNLKEIAQTARGDQPGFLMLRARQKVGEVECWGSNAGQIRYGVHLPVQGLWTVWISVHDSYYGRTQTCFQCPYHTDLNVLPRGMWKDSFLLWGSKVQELLHTKPRHPMKSASYKSTSFDPKSPKSCSLRVPARRRIHRDLRVWWPCSTRSDRRRGKAKAWHLKPSANPQHATPNNKGEALKSSNLFRKKEAFGKANFTGHRANLVARLFEATGFGRLNPTPKASSMKLKPQASLQPFLPTCFQAVEP